MKKNLIDVLKKLLTAFGGDAKDVKNNAVDIIDKIADNASSGNSGGGSGSGSLIVEFDYDTGTASEANYLVSNISAKDIIAAYSSGQPVLFKFNGFGSDSYGTYATMACFYSWSQYVQAEGKAHPEGEIYYIGHVTSLSDNSENIVDFDAPVKFRIYWD